MSLFIVATINFIFWVYVYKKWCNHAKLNGFTQSDDYKPLFTVLCGLGFLFTFNFFIWLIETIE